MTWLDVTLICSSSVWGRTKASLHNNTIIHKTSNYKLIKKNFRETSYLKVFNYLCITIRLHDVIDYTLMKTFAIGLCHNTCLCWVLTASLWSTSSLIFQLNFSIKIANTYTHTHITNNNWAILIMLLASGNSTDNVSGNFVDAVNPCGVCIKGISTERLKSSPLKSSEMKRQVWTQISVRAVNWNRQAALGHLLLTAGLM